MVRCKFYCAGKEENWDAYGKRKTWNYKFYVVTGGSEENKTFFAYTPSGNFEVKTCNDQSFEVGKEYYFDILPAEQ